MTCLTDKPSCSKAMRRKCPAISLLIILIVSSVLSACQKPAVTPLTPMPTATTSILPSPTTVVTPEPPESLTVCSAEEPHSLFLYDGNYSQSKLNILAAIYDGPIDLVNGSLQPVILENIPTHENGGLTLESVPVRAGMEVVDANGQLHVIQKGIFVRPAGCHETACAVNWDGESELRMDVMRLTFTILPGLLWSDGAPLTASDSLFSFHLASDPNLPVSDWAIHRTAAYEMLDDTTLVWQGLPGFTTTAVDRFFWSPLPLHALADIASSDLITHPLAGSQPLSYGAWQILDWQKGSALHLVKNTCYFRADESLPYFDQLTFRFIPDLDAALNAFQQGECDILDASYHLEGRAEILTEFDNAIQVDLLSGQWIGLTFGIQPASYDDGYDQAAGDRPDFFSDDRVRQAFAFCIDRQRIVDEVLGGRSAVPQGLMPWLADGELAYPSDPTAGIALLEAAGWYDLDMDLATPRTAQAAVNVLDGTTFSISLHTGPATFDQLAASVIVGSLAGCGVAVTHVPLSLSELYAPGPEGKLFGRQFDLALFTWAGVGTELCSLYQSWAVPGQENYWIGANLAGFQDPSFDAACNDALFSISNNQDYLNKLDQSYLTHLPSLPLIYMNSMIVVQKGLTLPQVNLRIGSDWDWLEQIIRKK